MITARISLPIIGILYISGCTLGVGTSQRLYITVLPAWIFKCSVYRRSGRFCCLGPNLHWFIWLHVQSWQFYLNDFTEYSIYDYTKLHWKWTELSEATSIRYAMTDEFCLWRAPVVGKLPLYSYSHARANFRRPGGWRRMRRAVLLPVGDVSGPWRHQRCVQLLHLWQQSSLPVASQVGRCLPTTAANTQVPFVTAAVVAAAVCCIRVPRSNHQLSRSWLCSTSTKKNWK